MISIDVGETHLGLIGNLLCLVGTYEALWHFGDDVVVVVVVGG